MSAPLAVPRSGHNSSTTSLLEDEDEDVTLYHPVHSPCSPSILLNPLHGSPSSRGAPSSPVASTSSSASSPPQAASGRRPSIQAQMVSVEATPPAHWEGPEGAVSSPPRGEGRYSRSNSASRASEFLEQDPREGASLISSVSEGGEFGNRLKFAPLPAGRRAYRCVVSRLRFGASAAADVLRTAGPTRCHWE